MHACIQWGAGGGGVNTIPETDTRLSVAMIPMHGGQGDTTHIHGHSINRDGPEPRE